MVISVSRAAVSLSDPATLMYKAAEQILANGRARAIGVSNFSQRQLENLIAQTEVVPAVNQVELHPFFSQPALREFHAANDIATQAWSPLGGVNRYRPADADTVENPLEHPTIVELAAKHGKTPAQVVPRWHLEHGVSAIPKSVKPHRIEENFDVFDFALTPDEVAAIDALDTGKRGGPDPELVDTEHYPFRSRTDQCPDGRTMNSTRSTPRRSWTSRPCDATEQCAGR